MRRILFLILILIIPLASSISTTMLPTYQPGETMIIEIQGNILEPIKSQDIVFRRAHVAIAVDYDVKRIGDKYYLYAQMPLNQNNYTLFINNLATTVNGQNQEIDYNQTFKVQGNMSDYSISPGFIISDKNFVLTINSKLDLPTTINLNFPDERTVTLQPGVNNIQMQISSVNQGIYSATIGKYIVPIQVTKTESNQAQEILISISPSSIKQTILTNQQKYYKFSITNTGSTKADNLYFSFNQNIFNITPSIINSIQPGNSQEFNLTLKRTNNPILESIFVARNDKILANITLNISFTNNESQTTNNSGNNQYYCSELNGKFCSATETCSIQTIQSLDGSSCCTGVCQEEKKSSNSWITYLSIILILIILFFIYRSYKNNKIPKINKPSPISPPLRKQI
ncbi:hypothetical protein J4423_00945 [Candidatus Pacearchaeota archaeon]|nr:hypothetical protein [Candidatus Pacearchaeota archaeon]